MLPHAKHRTWPRSSLTNSSQASELLFPWRLRATSQSLRNILPHYRLVSYTSVWAGCAEPLVFGGELAGGAGAQRMDECGSDMNQEHSKHGETGEDLREGSRRAKSGKEGAETDDAARYTFPCLPSIPAASSIILPQVFLTFTAFHRSFWLSFSHNRSCDV